MLVWRDGPLPGLMEDVEEDALASCVEWKETTASDSGKEGWIDVDDALGARGDVVVSFGARRRRPFLREGPNGFALHVEVRLLSSDRACVWRRRRGGRTWLRAGAGRSESWLSSRVSPRCLRRGRSRRRCQQKSQWHSLRLHQQQQQRQEVYQPGQAAACVQPSVPPPVVPEQQVEPEVEQPEHQQRSGTGSTRAGRRRTAITEDRTTLLERFLCLLPPMFSGEYDPDKRFLEVFHGEYFSDYARRERRDQFHELVQGDLTVSQYHQRFVKLLRHRRQSRFAEYSVQQGAEQGSQEAVCYTYGLPSHFWRDCPTGQAPQEQQPVQYAQQLPRRPGRDLIAPDRFAATGLDRSVPGRRLLVAAEVADASWSRRLTASAPEPPSAEDATILEVAILSRWPCRSRQDRYGCHDSVVIGFRVRSYTSLSPSARHLRACPCERLLPLPWTPVLRSLLREYSELRVCSSWQPNRRTLELRGKRWQNEGHSWHYGATGNLPMVELNSHVYSCQALASVLLGSEAKRHEVE
ncbi:hypothetical protein Taro_028266 [Colocasia esculenta]|uniref:Retrotransposon gag domain-containing protein n=1 Tax=Colocasia esculenta TaxID=4460 RepID=A0A843VKK7_COLES|nr:hypothetical protein [Colocasia esculenta]